MGPDKPRLATTDLEMNHTPLSLLVVLLVIVLVVAVHDAPASAPVVQAEHALMGAAGGWRSVDPNP